MPKSKRNKKRSRGKSGYVGVFKLPSGKYRASIRIDGKIKNLGSYDTGKQAAKAYDKEAIKLRRPFSKLNYPKKAPVGYTPTQQPLQSRNTVGYRGVSKNGKNFQAQIIIDGKKTCHGTYDTAKEAAIAYDRAVLKANKSTTLLNFPDMVHNLDVEPKRKKRKLSSTGYKGVSTQASGRFQTIFGSGGKKKALGTFDTAIQAALAYDQAAIKAGKKKSTLNFPDGLPIKQESDIDDGEGFWV
jgi:phosphotransferase system IIB component